MLPIKNCNHHCGSSRSFDKESWGCGRFKARMMHAKCTQFLSLSFPALLLHPMILQPSLYRFFLSYLVRSQTVLFVSIETKYSTIAAKVALLNTLYRLHHMLYIDSRIYTLPTSYEIPPSLHGDSQSLFV